MPGALAKLMVIIGADSTKFQKEMARTEKGLEKSAQKMGNFGRMMTAALTVPLAAAGVGLTKLAMEAVESENLFEVSMGGMAGSARAWSEQLRGDLGLNAYEVRKNVGMFYTMFESMKIGSKDAYTLSTGITQLAYDMASFYNLPIEQAFEKLSSGMTGEIEPLKRLGIIVNETTVKEYAYANGIAKTGAELSEQQKILARYGVIMAATSKAQGDLARTIDSPANQLRIMSQRAKQLGIDLGMSLLPVMKDIMNTAEPFAVRIEKLVKHFNSLEPATRKNIIAGLGMLAAMGPIALMMAAITSVTGKVVGGIGGIVAIAGRAYKALVLFQTGTIGVGGALRILAGGPVGAIIMGIGVVIAGIVLLTKNMDLLKYHGLQAWAALKTDFIKGGRTILLVLEQVFGFIPGLGDKIRDNIAKLDDLIGKETSIFNARVAAYNIKDMVDETDRYAAAQKRAAGAVEETADREQKFGDYASKASDKSEKAATKWIGTSDQLINSLTILRSAHEAAAMKAEMHGDKLASLQLHGRQLNDDLTKQKEIVARVKEEIIANTVAGVLQDETQEDLAKRTDELNKKLADEEKAQADIEKQIYDTNQAIKTQAQDLRDLSEEVTKAKKKYQDELTAALTEYQAKAKEINTKLADDEKKLTQEYENQVDQRAKALRDFVGLFDAVTPKEVSGAQLLENLRGQVKTFEDWSANIQTLAARGVDQGLIAELKEMGPKAAPEIAALNTLTDEQLVEYVNLWRTKNEEARAEAVTQLEQQKLEMQQKLIEIRMAAAEQLTILKSEWQKKNAEIRANAEEEMKRIEQKFIEVAGAGTKYGAELISNFSAGMESQFDQALEKLRKFAQDVEDLMPAHSPAKKGPFANLEKWGSNFFKEIFKGMDSMVPNLKADLSAISPDLLSAIRSPVVNVATPAVAMATGGNTTFNITISGSNADEIWNKFERKLALKGWR